MQNYFTIQVHGLKSDLPAHALRVSRINAKKNNVYVYLVVKKSQWIRHVPDSVSFVTSVTSGSLEVSASCQDRCGPCTLPVLPEEDTT